MALLGVRQIELYSAMIKEWFDPAITALKGRTSTVEQEIRTQAKKNLGIYDMLARKAVLELQIKEIEVQTESATKASWRQDGRWRSKLDEETERITERLNPKLAELKKMRADSVDDLKMSSASPALLKVFFLDLKEGLAGILKDVKTLPPITHIMKVEDKNGKR